MPKRHNMDHGYIRFSMALSENRLWRGGAVLFISNFLQNSGPGLVVVDRRSLSNSKWTHKDLSKQMWQHSPNCSKIIWIPCRCLCWKTLTNQVNCCRMRVFCNSLKCVTFVHTSTQTIIIQYWRTWLIISFFVASFFSVTMASELIFPLI